MGVEGHYPLTRDSRQLIRVNLLQHLWRDAFRYLLHPQIPAGSILRVADVATASGLWLCELEKTHPNIQELNGFDISPASFIDACHLPEKVTLTVGDASKPVPPSMVGKYDVVHVRLLQAVVLNDDPSWIIRYCMDLLRPGGYLQWEEFDPLEAETHVAPGIRRPSRLEELTQKLRSRVPGRWVGALPQILEAHGMRSLAVEKTRGSPWHHLTITYLFCQVFEEFADTFLDKEGPSGSGDAMRELVKESFEEALQGSYSKYLYQMAVAQKPM